MGKQSINRQKKAQIVPFFQDGQYFYRKGMKAYRERDLMRASKWIQRAVQLEPNHAVMLSQLASIYTELGKYQQSNELLTYILTNIDKALTECHYFMANNYAHLGLFHEAYKCAIHYKTEEPNGEFIEETEDLLDLLTIEGADEEDAYLDSDELIVKQDTAKSLLENGKLEEAISMLKEIVTEFPEFWSAYNNLSLAYFYTGDVEQAKVYLNMVLDKNPGNLHALCNLLVFYYYERQDDKVEELAQRLGQIYPILFEHRYKLGATFALVGQYELAYKWLRAIYRQGFDGDDTFYYWLSYSAYHTGKEDFARTCWERVMDVNPEKAGSEPWAQQEKTTERPMSMSIEERLLAIFLAAETKQLDQIHVFQTAKVPQSSFEKEFMDLAIAHVNGEIKKSVSEKLKFTYQAAQVLFENNKTLNEELYLFFFKTALKAKREELPLKNHLAWAGALEYVWKKENGFKVTQTEMAKQYSISGKTLSKYSTVIKKLWS
ncbi:tetratricopeptide repeat protein [Metabacillus idriensis]|uniref:tetratricopeptide repeat protein n=1 Tax=Metabacillus idriensis TaxID=324768 RepID=UPI001CD57E78|nr:tetratricopeptide repeat protein [Metabacillus idriensis]